MCNKNADSRILENALKNINVKQSEYYVSEQFLSEVQDKKQHFILKREKSI
jgi:hypothetical protein